MESWLARIVDYLLAQSWQIAILTALVATASFALRKRSAHVRYLLWLLVLAKCLVPPFYSVPLAVLPEGEPLRSTAVPVFNEALELDIAVRSSSETGEAAMKPVIPVYTATGGVAEPAATLSFSTWLGAAWVIGALALGCMYLLKAVRMQVWLQSHRMPLPQAHRMNLLNSPLAHSMKRLPHIWLVYETHQPFVWGLCRGSIYVPGDLAESRDLRSLSSLLGHELSHVIRFDAAVNVLQVIAQVVFWFHPLVWWANRKIRQEREKCCDEATIARLDTKPEEYSSAIVETLAAKCRAVSSTRGVEKTLAGHRCTMPARGGILL